MLVNLIQRIFPATDPTRAKSFFLVAQMAFAGAILLLIYFAGRRKESGFRLREADKKSGARARRGGADPLADARIQRSEPLRLPGIRIDGRPHEILGVSRDAKASEIQGAYRELMKRYHPDVVGRPGTREWADAQRIAEALNQARAQMLSALQAAGDHSQSPKRSGR